MMLLRQLHQTVPIERVALSAGQRRRDFGGAAGIGDDFEGPRFGREAGFAELVGRELRGAGLQFVVDGPGLVVAGQVLRFWRRGGGGRGRGRGAPDLE